MASSTPTQQASQQSRDASDSSRAAGGAAPSATASAGRRKALRGKSLAQQNAMLRPPGARGNSAPSHTAGPLDTSSFERWVQSGLNAIGQAHDLLPAPLTVDGKLGRHSRGAVRAFQRHAREVIGKPLGVDGIVGPKTTQGLEIGTNSSAPTVKEKDRVQHDDAGPQAKPDAVTEIPGTDPSAGAAGGASGASGGSATPPAPKASRPKPKQSGKDAVVEKPHTAGAAKNLAEGKDPESTPAKGKTGDPAKDKPTAPRSGDAGKADRLRQKWPKGMLVSLSIPAAYKSPEDAIKYVEGGHSLDSYAYRVHYPKWAQEHEDTIQAKWTTIRPANSKLPAKYSDATPKQKKAIIAKVSKNRAAYRDIKAKMWSDESWRLKLAKTAYGNNKYIPNSTASFAKAQGAVAGEGGTVQFGKSMIYNKPAELSSKVVATSKAAAALLKANPLATGTAPAADATTSKVRFLTIASHGWPTGMGGHGAAHSAKFSKKQVPGIVSAMSSALTGDVRIRLFACKTSRVKNSQDSEGSIGDAFRDALLAEGKKDGAVIGHTESGDTQRNSKTRFMKANSGTGHLDWRYNTVFDTAFINTWLAQVGAKPTKATRKVARSELKAFFGREGWMEDITDEAALIKSVRARWNAKYPDAASLGKSLRKKLGVRLPKSGK